MVFGLMVFGMALAVSRVHRLAPSAPATGRALSTSRSPEGP